MFKKARLDVDSLIAKVRATYSGQGGPLGDGHGVAAAVFDDPTLSRRFDKLMLDLDRMNLMRIAAEKVPLAMPLHDDLPLHQRLRLPPRSDGRGARMHAGVDLAAPRGTPVFATADGVVVAAGRESGYGNVVRVQHEFGFETVYAHQSRHQGEGRTIGIAWRANR